MLVLSLFVLGLIFGSFFNVVILRYSPGESLFGTNLLGRSKCSSCHKTLSPLELFPIFSFIFQLGKCRNCKVRLALQYPIVELLTGLIFVTAPIQFGYSLYSILWICVLSLFLIIAVIDMKHYVIPDSANVALIVLGLCNTFLLTFGYVDNLALVPGSFLKDYAFIFNIFNNTLVSHLMAGILISGFFAMLIYLSKGKAMGWGDVKFGFGLGLLLGFVDSIMSLMIAYTLGAIVGIFLIIKGRKGMQDVMPFGPFMALGAVIVFYFGYDIMTYYFHLLELAVF